MNKDEKKALEYHYEPSPGKIAVVPTVSCTTADELSLAYTPGVAYPCIKIKENADDAYKYTIKGNLVGVISNGTAVLGLGNIGPFASKPVMEGKGILFKRFANIDVFDIEVDESDPQKFIDIVAPLEPTFGGINLEDIKAPECFEIEEKLRKRMNIPVFHDDQHGTAVILAAGLLNALEIADKKIESIKVVMVGAGAAGIACAKLIVDLGVQKKNIFMFDSQGLIVRSRNVNQYKAEFAQEKDTNLVDTMNGTDVFIGVSKAGLLSQDMVRSMNKTPIVFAMANPDPEITYKDGVAARKDIIMATGRSDYPNQVNNVLGFPFIFRGALDVRATTINKEMKLAAVHALADLAHELVPQEIVTAYGKTFSFGKEYIIPKPFDPRVLYYVAPAVAKAAMESGVAQKPLQDLDTYTEILKGMATRLSQGNFHR
ncbi:hypothetical protein HOL21_00925 [Candidatus Woesearchaeota archaeon]|nr:hypothetical protein [Candidatus Woesearchaeota archaeon]MBT5396758.1 hypothetical protein [Candidatus Woesearchaeota archaeon]MBT5924718.1 hypothetical protein [Candidatus Woesearchaeota archaeon]MBT6367646.1 hypothetical protein [Candidatus Woesearchaeota archaeon]MBT7762953.1 hypothetical protein [Candidatus Woesearchaeota archaeon]